MLQMIQALRSQAGGNVPVEVREQQVANFVGPTLVELGFGAWVHNHGGMVSQRLFIYFFWSILSSGVCNRRRRGWKDTDALHTVTDLILKNP